MKTIAHVSSPIAPPQSTSKSGISEGSLCILILILPAVLASGVLLYKQYRVVKQRRQVETLERIWKLNHREKTT